MGKCHSVGAGGDLSGAELQLITKNPSWLAGSMTPCVCFCSAFITIYGALNCVFLENAAAAAPQQPNLQYLDRNSVASHRAGGELHAVWTSSR